jgi:ankyrin repeat protein
MATPDKMLDAVKAGKLAQVKKLLDADASLVNARAESGESAILLSIYYGHKEIGDLLLARGAVLNIFEAAAAGELAQLEALESAAPGAIKTFSHDGFTPLHLAAFFGQMSTADFLLSRGVDVNATSKNASALRPIHSAVAHRGDPEVALAIAQALVAAGAEINVAQQGGWTPLHAAAFHGHTAMVEFLLAHGADVRAKADNGQTALAMAVGKKHAEAVALLRKKGATS